LGEVHPWFWKIRPWSGPQNVTELTEIPPAQTGGRLFGVEIPSVALIRPAASPLD
jgi:hypothetical protein